MVRINEVDVFEYDIDVQVKWKCPTCDVINVTKFSPSIFRVPAFEIPEDVECINCKECFNPKL